MEINNPELTWSCPPRVTADAGLDALTHAIESWLTMDAAVFEALEDPDPSYSGRNELTMLFAREATSLVFRHLVDAFEEPRNRAARSGMARASLYAAMSYATAGLNAVHGLAYALAGITHATHGSTNAVMLPYVMDALVEIRAIELAEIARLAGAKGTDTNALARQAPVLVQQLVRRVGLADNLKTFGLTEDKLPQLVTDGLAVKRLADAWPGASTQENYTCIVRNAFFGKLSGNKHQ